ncbi:MAG: hypothetical protein U1E60_09000 [Reyranellaceae bacterium]
MTASAPTPGRVAFAVQDSGIGISDGDQERVFDEFIQIRNPLQDGSRDPGWACLYRASSPKRWAATSRSAARSAKAPLFTLDIPVVLPGHSVEEAARADANGKILIVDDEESTRYVLRHMLAGRWSVVDHRSARRHRRPAPGAGRGARLHPARHLPARAERLRGLSSLKGDPATAAIPVLVLDIIDSRSGASGTA